MVNPPQFQQHDLVTKRDGDGSVGTIRSKEPTVHAGECWYLVQFGASRENCREADLRPFQEEISLTDLLSGDSYGGPDALRRHVTAVKLRSQLTDTLYSFGASRTRLYPYQFIPLLKLLTSPYRRILIADEVGLGKTIEAGYILQEELARGRLARVLIVCPSSLRLKWHDEMLNRFGHRFEILDAAGARRRVPIFDRQVAAAHPLRAIASLQSIRNEAFIDTVAGSSCPLDLLIVDEAHHCRNSLTLQARAVSALVEQADSVVFLSATPIQTSELNLFTLLNMLIPEEFPSEPAFRQRLRLNRPIVEAETLLRQRGEDKIVQARDRLLSLTTDVEGNIVTSNPLFQDLLTALNSAEPDSAARRVELQEQLSHLNQLSIVFTRTKRRSVTLTMAQRRAIIPEARLSPLEQDAYDSVCDLIFERYQERHGDGTARFILTTYQRQLASSIPAAIRKFRDLIESSEDEWYLEMDDSDDESNTDEVRYRPIDDPEFRDIVRGIDVSALELGDSKYALLTEALRNHRSLVEAGERRSRKTLVFSYFRRTLDYLERRLTSDGFRLVRIDGSVKSVPDDPIADERQRRIAKFRDDPDIDIMLTSEVGSEGLDFQFCDTMVNWDLPWNPMVVEQRIGRLDRIGQQSEQILIINLACEGTIEERILRRLYQRIGIFEHSIGELEPILGEMVRALERDLFRPGQTPEEQMRILHSQEIAIETQRKTQEALEQDADLLIGHDEFFRTKMDMIRRFGRYIGGDELRLFAENELKSIAPGSYFERDLTPDLFRLAYRREVEQLIESTLPRGDDEGVRFLAQYRRGSVRFAFDGETADRHPGVEPIHAQHPLIRALAGRLDVEITSRPQVASLTVVSTAVAEGPWFYLWALIVESGFLSAKSLLCAVIDLRRDSLRSVPPEAGDALLADMLRSGRPWPDFCPPSRADGEACLSAAENQIRSRVADLSQRRSARMEAIKSARRGTVEVTFGMRIERQRARVADMERRAASESGAQRILSAFRGRLEHLETERVVQLDRIASLPLGTVTYSLLGAGFVNVRPGGLEGHGDA